MKTLAVLLASAALSIAAPKVEVGSINGAAFRIDVPENWNGGLVVYCHGYNPQAVKFNDGKMNPVLQVFADQGYAVAQSGYAAGGWAVEQAATDTESLRRYFIDKYGKPKETFITGHSMGGFLTMMLMESHPTAYDAGMPLCGPLAATDAFMARGAFDSYVLFNYYFPGVLPEPTKIPKDYTNTTGDRELQAKILKALESDEAKAASLRKFHDTNAKSNRDLAGTTAFIVYLIKELNERAGGNPFDNRYVIYNGTLDDNKTNSEIARYAADPKAQAYLRSFYSPSGRISNPMLAIHTSYDPLVPVWIPNMYASTVDQAGNANLYVQQFVKHDGHCTITPDETAKGFAQLRDWKAKGVRPQGGEVPKGSVTATGNN